MYKVHMVCASECKCGCIQVLTKTGVQSVAEYNFAKKEFHKYITTPLPVVLMGTNRA